jgi:phage-related minor tail protein
LGALANSTGLLAKVFTPLGIAITGSVAAVAALGVATFKSEKQAEEFNKALAATGRFGTVTGATLQGVAAQVGVLTGSYSDAADAVMALTRAGKGLDSNLTGLATTVTNISAITGEAIDKVANNLVELEKDPVAAITKTTSLMGLLTTAQFKEIAALQETQGPAAAAALAIKDIGTAAEQTSKQLDDNSGYILQFLHSVESFGSRSLFLLENVGSKAISTQIAVLQAQKQNLQDTLSSQAADIIPGYAAVIRKSISQADAQIAQLQERQKSQAMFSAGQDLAAQSKLKLEQAYNALGQNELKTADNLQATYKAINDQRRMALALATTQGQRDTINANANQKILDATKKYNEQFAGGGGAVRTPRAPKDNSDKARQQALDELRQEVQWQGKLDDATQAYQNSLDDMLATRKQQIALQVESVGMGQKEFAQRQELIRIDDEYNRKLAQLDRSYEQEATTLAANGQLDRLAEAKAAYETQRAALKQHYGDMAKDTVQGYVDLATAQGNGLNGMKAAMQDFIDA